MTPQEHDNLMFAQRIAALRAGWDNPDPRQQEYAGIEQAGAGAIAPSQDPLTMATFNAYRDSVARNQEAALRRIQTHEQFDQALKMQGQGFAHEEAASRQKHEWGKPLEGAQIGAATAAAEASRAQTGATQAETALRQRAVTQPIETRTPAAIENEARATKLEEQLAGLQAQENPEAAAATLRGEIAKLRGQPAAASQPSAVSASGLNQREREALVTQLAGQGDFEGVRMLRGGSRPEDVPTIRAQRAEARDALIKEAAKALDVTAPWFSQGEGTEEPHAFQAGYVTKSTDRALQRARLLLSKHPKFATLGITPEEIVAEYHGNVD